MMTAAHNILRLTLLNILLAGYACSATAVLDNNCPTTKGDMKRVGDTRYFIFHNPRGKKDKFVTWDEAKKQCSSKPNFKMATIEKLTTFAEVGRALEKLVTNKSLQDTWYWLDAKYNSKLQQYVWGEQTSRQLKFTNFFYRYPRPTGLGGYVNQYDKYKINETIEQCLTMSLPLPAANNMKMTARGGIILYATENCLGYSASFDEKPCDGKTKRHAMCESTLADCNSSSSDPFTLTENKDSYFEDGNWIIGDRRYVINWKQVSKIDGERYCKNLGLELFNPNGKERSLIPHLKMWSRGITFSQFWTNWSYVIATPGDGRRGIFYDAMGNEKSRLRAFVNLSVTEMDDLIDSRSNKFDTKFCVAMQLSYEYKHSQYPCPKKFESVCDWSFIQYVPANCMNLQGTICQHKDHESRSSLWKKSWIKNPQEFLQNSRESTVEFGFKGNNNTFRSRYKQTFGSLICPPGYRMPRHEDKKWHMQPMKTDYLYDYQESYWVVDGDGFMKTNRSQCSLSVPLKEGYTRKIAMVPCTDWHFYLCDVVNFRIKIRDYKLQYEIPTSIPWDDMRQERKYPIIS